MDPTRFLELRPDEESGSFTLSLKAQDLIGRRMRSIYVGQTLTTGQLYSIEGIIIDVSNIGVVTLEDCKTWRFYREDDLKDLSEELKSRASQLELELEFEGRPIIEKGYLVEYKKHRYQIALPPKSGKNWRMDLIKES